MKLFACSLKNVLENSKKNHENNSCQIASINDTFSQEANKRKKKEQKSQILSKSERLTYNVKGNNNKLS